MVASRILGYGKEYEFKINGEEHKTDLTKLDLNVLEVALTHLIEELKDEINLQEQLDSAKAMYLALGNKSFWGDE